MCLMCKVCIDVFDRTYDQLIWYVQFVSIDVFDMCKVDDVFDIN